MFQKLLCLSLVVLLIGCAEKKTDTAKEGEALMQTSRNWSKAAATGNVDSILSYWADDAVVMSPGEMPLKGKEAIRGMIEASSKIPGFRISWEPRSAFVSESGDLGYLTEETQISMNDSLGKPFTLHNKAVTIWRKDGNGNWKNIVDIWNANPMPANP
jgi:ketosteroid isomerase-like protein